MYKYSASSPCLPLEGGLQRVDANTDQESNTKDRMVTRPVLLTSKPEKTGESRGILLEYRRPTEYLKKDLNLRLRLRHTTEISSDDQVRIIMCIAGEQGVGI